MRAAAEGPESPPDALLDGEGVRRWLVGAAAAMRLASGDIDRLNVFPVPDGDTGTNLRLTLDGAAAAVDAAGGETSAGALLGVAARGALLAARGNSGVIVSQLLHGWADAVDGAARADAATVVAALTAADEQAWAAVETPADGTILSVSRSAALAAADALVDHPSALDEVVLAAARAAREALARTTAELDALTRAGVVDAGGAGLVVLLDALVTAVTGRSAEHLDLPPAARPGDACDEPATGGRWEVMYLLRPDETTPGPAGLRRRLASVGTSVAVVGGPDLWNVHVHTDDADAAVRAGEAAGSPEQVRVTDLTWVPPEAAPTPGPVVLVLACAAGPGVRRVVTEAGAVALPSAAGGDWSTDTVTDAVRASGAATVVVLLDDAAGEAAVTEAGTAEDEAGRVVVPVVGSGPVHVLAALAAVGLLAASSDVGVVAAAARAAVVATRLVEVAPGDPAAHAVGRVGELLADGGDLVTVLAGTDVAPDRTAALEAGVRALDAELEVLVVTDGRPGEGLSVGVE